MGTFQDHLAAHKNTILVFSTLAIFTTTLLLLALLRFAQILPTPASPDGTKTAIPQRPPPSLTNPTHLLVVLGSGGHTAEMLNILTSIPNLSQNFTHRTYLVSSGDAFSASKAVDFEKEHVARSEESAGSYTVVPVRRARKVHQSFWSTPVTALLSLWDCIAVLQGQHKAFGSQTAASYPDLIVTNGPGTGVCVVVAALLLRFCGYGGAPATAAIDKQVKATFTGGGQMRTIFIESWARVKTLSLSGKILKPIVNRFFVQWPQLAEIHGDGVEYIGPLVS